MRHKQISVPINFYLHKYRHQVKFGLRATVCQFPLWSILPVDSLAVMSLSGRCDLFLCLLGHPPSLEQTVGVVSTFMATGKISWLQSGGKVVIFKLGPQYTSEINKFSV